jgi:hypothetical protein
MGVDSMDYVHTNNVQICKVCVLVNWSEQSNWRNEETRESI